MPFITSFRVQIWWIYEHDTSNGKNRIIQSFSLNKNEKWTKSYTTIKYIATRIHSLEKQLSVNGTKIKFCDNNTVFFMQKWIFGMKRVWNVLCLNGAIYSLLIWKSARRSSWITLACWCYSSHVGVSQVLPLTVPDMHVYLSLELIDCWMVDSCCLYKLYLTWARYRIFYKILNYDWFINTALGSCGAVSTQRRLVKCHEPSSKCAKLILFSEFCCHRLVSGKNICDLKFGFFLFNFYSNRFL